VLHQSPPPHRCNAGFRRFGCDILAADSRPRIDARPRRALRITNYGDRLHEAAHSRYSRSPGRSGRHRLRRPGRRFQQRPNWRRQRQHTAASASNGGRGGAKVSDSEITSAIKDAFKQDPQLAAASISVAVENGAVTLSGNVPNAQTYNRAISVARSAPGVRPPVIATNLKFPL